MKPFRWADADDVDDVVALVNCAYEVEAFFVSGDRTSPEAVRRMLETGGILLADASDADTLRGCIYVVVTGARAYFGLLAVDPVEQGRGLGRALIHAAEDHARLSGARAMDITVVSVRPELVRFYERLGYSEAGTEPYVDRPVLMPVHFVRMSKRL